MADKKETINENQLSIGVFNFSEHIPLDVEPVVGRKWVLNGEDNSMYHLISDAYDDSSTNAAIINGFTQYIYGDGLVDTVLIDDLETDPKKIKKNLELAQLAVSKYVSKRDVRLACQDFKTYGAYCLQVIWNSAEDKSLKRPIKIEWVSIKSIGLNIDDNMYIDGYWYCFDWSKKTKYKPELFERFTGTYKDQDIELLVVSRPSPRPFFAQPDYISGIRYAQLEGELSNYAYATTQNGFQAGMIVNCNNGTPETEELKNEYTKQIVNNLTGTNKAGKVIVAFNKDATTAMTIEPVPTPERNELYTYFAEEAEKKLKIAHNAPPILFSGSQEGGGFSNNADEIVTATKSLYRKSIYPMRENIVEDGFQFIFNKINDKIKLDFRDYEEFKEDGYKNKG